MYPLKWQTKPDQSMLITLRMEGWWWSIRSIDSYAIRILLLPVASILFPLLNSQQSQPRGHRLKFQNAFRTKPSIALLRNMLQGLFRHSMMWLPCLRAYGSRILTSNGFLLPLSFIAAILSSQCQMLSLFRSNFVPQISFREASPFFYQKNKAKVNFSIIYSCFISWVFRLFESQFLQRVWNFWKIRKCIIYIKFSRSLPFTKWVIIFSQCRLN